MTPHPSPDPRVTSDPLSWTRDDVVIGVLGAGAAAVLFLLVICVLWVAKSRHRRREKLHRRNSIRSSVRSTRSLASSFSDMSGGGGYRRRPNVSGNQGKGQDWEDSDMSGVFGVLCDLISLLKTVVLISCHCNILEWVCFTASVIFATFCFRFVSLTMFISCNLCAVPITAV